MRTSYKSLLAVLASAAVLTGCGSLDRPSDRETEPARQIKDVLVLVKYFKRSVSQP